MAQEVEADKRREWERERERRREEERNRIVEERQREIMEAKEARIEKRAEERAHTIIEETTKRVRAEMMADEAREIAHTKRTDTKFYYMFTATVFIILAILFYPQLAEPMPFADAMLRISLFIALAFVLILLVTIVVMLRKKVA